MGCAAGKTQEKNCHARPMLSDSSLQDNKTSGCTSTPLKVVGTPPDTERKSVHIAVIDIRWRGSKSRTLARSDPCCIVEMPGKPDSTFSTVVIQGTPGAAWNHEATFSGCSETDSLIFTIRDKEMQHVGGGSIAGDKFFDQGLQGDVPLYGGPGGEVVAMLKVKISSELDGSSAEETSSTRSSMAMWEAELNAEEPFSISLLDLPVPAVPVVPKLEGGSRHRSGHKSCLCH